ncbi:hypothetical protein LCGC14_1361620, partial [marine sediment metagenome]
MGLVQSYPPFSFNKFRHASIEFRCHLWKDLISSTPDSGSIKFGIKDTTTDQIVGSSILYSPSITPFAVSGSLAFAGLGLVDGRIYRPFTKKSLNVNAEVKEWRQPEDESNVSGSLDGSDLYINANGLGANHPDGYLFFNRTVGDGHNDEARYLKWDNDYDRFVMNDAL